MAHRTRQQVLINNQQRSIGASQSNVVVSDSFPVVEGSRLRVDVMVSSLTHTTGVTLKLQTTPCNDTAGSPIWKDVKSVASTTTLSADDVLTITLNPEVALDAAVLPLGLRCRVLCSTGTGDAIVIEAISVLEHNH